MQLSKNFTLAEMIRTSAPYENYPQVHERIALKQLVDNVLQPLRDMYGKPIRVNSGYRSPLVNKWAGGVDTKGGAGAGKISQHTKGEAADITAGSKAANKVLFELIRDNLDFDQLINEKGYSWIHVSYVKNPNRKQILSLP